MDSEIKHIRGLGFEVTVLEPSEHAEYPCDFHKLDGEVTALPCPEEPHVFMALGGLETGIAMCRKHYVRLVFDVLDTLEFLDIEDTEIPPEGETSRGLTKDNELITMDAFRELVMLTKRTISGAN